MAKKYTNTAELYGKKNRDRKRKYAKYSNSGCLMNIVLTFLVVACAAVLLIL